MISPLNLNSKREWCRSTPHTMASVAEITAQDWAFQLSDNPECKATLTHPPLTKLTHAHSHRLTHTLILFSYTYRAPTLCLLCHPSHNPIQPDTPPSHSSHPLPPTSTTPSLTPHSSSLLPLLSPSHHSRLTGWPEPVRRLAPGPDARGLCPSPRAQHPGPRQPRRRGEGR